MPRRLLAMVAMVAALALLTPPAFAALTGGVSVPEPAAPAQGRLSTGLSHDLATLAPTTPYAAFVNYTKGTDPTTAVELAGVQVLRSYPLVSAMFVVGELRTVASLAALPGVTYVEENRALALHGDTGTWASRVRVAQEAVAGGPYTDGSGNVIDGRGVGIAIVDAGVNSTHPDLTNVARNFKVVCSTPGLIATSTEYCFGNQLVDDLGAAPRDIGVVELPDGVSTDTTSGHGTHVAGIAAGTGAASTGSYPAGTGPNVKGTYTGVAPGATLYGFGVGEAVSVLYATEAHYYILDHQNDFSPRIAVVNNSWGETGGASYDPASISASLNAALVSAGITMVYSAGNDGGTGTTDATSSYCDDPTHGVICVANYDDLDAGGRDNQLDATSSRGISSDSDTWPDISAPGAFITSACVREVQPICNFGYVDEIRWGPWYGSISGTSMASPHIAGIVALLKQADPTLTPAGIENVLQDTAYKFTAGSPYVTDPDNVGGGTHSLDKGAGLADVKAALNALGTSHGTASAPSSFDVFANDGGDYAGPGAADIDKLEVTQTTGGPSNVAGMKYQLTVANASDFGVAPSITYRLYQAVKGVAYTINVVSTSAGALSAGTQTPPATVIYDMAWTGNVLSFFVPFSTQGNPAVGEPYITNRVGTYIGTVADAAPGSDVGLAQMVVRPMYGRSFARG